ncbi:MAG: hypothetical protein AB9866_00900 [Syntrophobacteraceae bacterium]
MGKRHSCYDPGFMYLKGAFPSKYSHPSSGELQKIGSFTGSLIGGELDIAKRYRPHAAG